MSKITRREFALLAAGAVTATSELPRPALAAGPAKIVIRKWFVWPSIVLNVRCAGLEVMDSVTCALRDSNAHLPL